MTLEINNDFYVNNLSDMAAAIKQTPETVCSMIVTEAVREYAERVREAREDAANALCGKE